MSNPTADTEITQITKNFITGVPINTFNNNRGFNVYIVGDSIILSNQHYDSTGTCYDYTVNSSKHKIFNSGNIAMSDISFGTLSGNYGPLSLKNGKIVSGSVIVPSKTTFIYNAPTSTAAPIVTSTAAPVAPITSLTSTTAAPAPITSIAAVPLYGGITLTLVSPINGSYNVNCFYVQPIQTILTPNTPLVPPVPPVAATPTILTNSFCNILQFNMDNVLLYGTMPNNITNSISSIATGLSQTSSGQRVPVTLTFLYNGNNGMTASTKTYTYNIPQTIQSISLLACKQNLAASVGNGMVANNLVLTSISINTA